MSGFVFKHYCGIKRDTALGTNGRMQKQTVSVANKSLFLPMPGPQAIENGFSIGTVYDVYFPSATFDVQEGDTLLWQSKEFDVRAVHPYDVPNVGHTHAIATKRSI